MISAAAARLREPHGRTAWRRQAREVEPRSGAATDHPSHPVVSVSDHSPRARTYWHSRTSPPSSPNCSRSLLPRTSSIPVHRNHGRPRAPTRRRSAGTGEGAAELRGGGGRLDRGGRRRADAREARKPGPRSSRSPGRPGIEPCPRRARSRERRPRGSRTERSECHRARLEPWAWARVRPLPSARGSGEPSTTRTRIAQRFQNLGAGRPGLEPGPPATDPSNHDQDAPVQPEAAFLTIV